MKKFHSLTHVLKEKPRVSDRTFIESELVTEHMYKRTKQAACTTDSIVFSKH